VEVVVLCVCAMAGAMAKLVRARQAPSKMDFFIGS
jgi:hypothetical protein